MVDLRTFFEGTLPPAEGFEIANQGQARMGPGQGPEATSGDPSYDLRTEEADVIPFPSHRVSPPVDKGTDADVSNIENYGSQRYYDRAVNIFNGWVSSGRIRMGAEEFNRMVDSPEFNSYIYDCFIDGTDATEALRDWLDMGHDGIQEGFSPEQGTRSIIWSPGEEGVDISKVLRMIGGGNLFHRLQQAGPFETIELNPHEAHELHSALVEFLASRTYNKAEVRFAEDVLSQLSEGVMREGMFDQTYTSEFDTDIPPGEKMSEEAYEWEVLTKMHEMGIETPSGDELDDFARHTEQCYLANLSPAGCAQGFRDRSLGEAYMGYPMTNRHAWTKRYSAPKPAPVAQLPADVAERFRNWNFRDPTNQEELEQWWNSEGSRLMTKTSMKEVFGVEPVPGRAEVLATQKASEKKSSGKRKFSMDDLKRAYDDANVKPPPYSALKHEAISPDEFKRSAAEEKEEHGLSQNDANAVAADHYAAGGEDYYKRLHKYVEGFDPFEVVLFEADGRYHELALRLADRKQAWDFVARARREVGWEPPGFNWSVCEEDETPAPILTVRGSAHALVSFDRDDEEHRGYMQNLIAYTQKKFGGDQKKWLNHKQMHGEKSNFETSSDAGFETRPDDSMVPMESVFRRKP